MSGISRNTSTSCRLKKTNTAPPTRATRLTVSTVAHSALRILFMKKCWMGSSTSAMSTLKHSGASRYFNSIAARYSSAIMSKYQPSFSTRKLP